MRAYTLTEVGKALAVKTGTGNEEEMSVLRYMYANRKNPITDSELEMRNPNARYVVRGLKRRGLVLELTQE